MPSPTYVAIAKTVLTGTQSTITFSSIPSTYTDLFIMATARTNRGTFAIDAIKIRFNGTTTDTNLTSNQMQSVNAGVQAQKPTYGLVGYSTASGSTSNAFGALQIYIPNYAGSNPKPILTSGASENNSTTTYEIEGGSVLFNQTDSLYEILLLSHTSSSFVAGSRFDLYGIKNS